MILPEKLPIKIDDLLAVWAAVTLRLFPALEALSPSRIAHVAPRLPRSSNELTVAAPPQHIAPPHHAPAPSPCRASSQHNAAQVSRPVDLATKVTAPHFEHLGFCLTCL